MNKPKTGQAHLLLPLFIFNLVVYSGEVQAVTLVKQFALTDRNKRPLLPQLEYMLTC